MLFTRCPHCNTPMKPLTCQFCYGTGKHYGRQCFACRGNGNYYSCANRARHVHTRINPQKAVRRKTCPHCHGTGRVQIRQPPRTPPEFLNPRTISSACGRCGGTGKVSW